MMHAILIALIVGAVVGFWLGYKAGRGIERVSIGADVIRRLLGK